MKAKPRDLCITRTQAPPLAKCFFGMCVMMLLPVAEADAQVATESQASPKTDRAALQRVSGPTSYDDDVGGLTKIGSYVRGARSVYEVFALREGSDSGAEVQVVTFPKGYRYAAHDAFGSLLMTAAYDAKLSGPGDLSAAVSKVRCVQWEFEDTTKGEVVCYAEVGDGRGQSGSVRWLAGTQETGLISVGIGYRNLAGLPGHVIDNYLREYPSNVPAQPTWHHDWETKDIEKWADVLKASKDDVQVLQAGAAYLTRYEKRAFGLLDALKKRDDAAAFSQSLEGVGERMSGLVEERKKAKEAGQRDK